MNLGAFHALLTDYRADTHVSKYEFIGRMLEVAAIGVTYAEIDNDTGNHYEVSCRHVFSQSPTRIPVSKVKARAILYQKEERFDHLVSYLEEKIINLDNLKKIIQEIIKTDNLRINNVFFSWQEPQYTDFLSYVESNYVLDEKQLIHIYAAYLTEYFYYCLLWSQIDYALPGIDEFHQNFHTDDNFYNELVQCFRFTNQYPQVDVFHSLYIFDAYKVIQQGNYLSVYENNLKANKFAIPSKLAHHILFKQAIFLDFYALFLSDDYLLIYHGNQPSQMPYRIIHKPYNRKMGVYDTFLKMEFLNQDGGEDNGVLIVLANHYYLKIKLNQLNWNSRDKMKKSGCATPDYELYELDALPTFICSEIQLKNSVATFHSLSDNNIFAHKLYLTSGKHEISTPLFRLRGEFENQYAFISSNHRFVLLRSNDRRHALRTDHAILFDLDNQSRYIELLQPVPIEGDNFASRLLKLEKSKSLIISEFTIDNHYFAFSTRESYKNDNEDNYRNITEVVDLQTMKRKKIEVNGNDQCIFVGFICDQILVQLIDKKPSVCYEQLCLTELFSDLAN